MKQFTTKAIVLKRLEFGETDRIITLLTPSNGKLTVLAKGVRKVASKLAGGIELFTINEVAIIDGKSDIKTLRSSRMEQYFPNISSDFARLQLGYDVLRAIDRQTEDIVEEQYYELLAETLSILNDQEVSSHVVHLWFSLKLLQLHGRQPDLLHDVNGRNLQSDNSYAFNPDEGGLCVSKYGQLRADHIKFARLCMTLKPHKLTTISGHDELASQWIRQMPALADS